MFKTINDKKKLQVKEKEMKRLLKQYRLDVEISSPFQAAKQLGTGKDTIYKYETGQSIPTLVILNSLIMLYGLNPDQRKHILELREEIIELRKKVK